MGLFILNLYTLDGLSFQNVLIHNLEVHKKASILN
jgi:hypothetical protein